MVASFLSAIERSSLDRYSSRVGSAVAADAACLAATALEEGVSFRTGPPPWSVLRRGELEEVVPEVREEVEVVVEADDAVSS